MMGPTVKSERHDEHEINEMARKILEQNRNKVTMAQHQAGINLGNHMPMQMARPGQPIIQNYMGMVRQTNGLVPAQHQQIMAPMMSAQSTAAAKAMEAAAAAAASERKIDQDSKKGKFGWCEFEKNYIPFIFRGNGDRFTSVRMVERKFLSRFLNVLPPEVNSCHCIRSYYITDSESRLLNEINLKHSDCYFGKEAFTTKDLVVRLKDAKEFYRFLDLCYKKLVLKKSNASDRCGFFRINGESVVPYTVRDNVKFVPLFYFEGETDHLRLKSDQVEGWDLAYLKFCCKVQGIRNELFAADVCRVVALDEIKGHFPPGTTFEDYWPAKGSIEPVSAQRTPAGNWTQKPAVVQQQAVHNGMKQQQGIQQQQQQQAYRPAASPYDTHLMAANHNYQLIRQGLANSLSHYQTNSVQQQQQQSARDHVTAAYQYAASTKQFPTKLTQIKEFPIERSQQLPYKLQKALIDQKIVPCINVRPYVFHDLMMTLPDFVKNFCPEFDMERARHMLQDILKVVLYKGNKGHQDILKAEGKCQQFDPAPLVLVKDIMNYMPQMKYMFANQVDGHQTAKRMKVN